MIKNIDTRFNYANMYNWTNDLPENSIQNFMSVIHYFNQKQPKGKKTQILEIGTFVGTSAIKLVESIKNSAITVIDLWEDYEEKGGVFNTVDKIKLNNIEQIFHDNINAAGLKHLVTVRKGRSFDILISFIKSNQTFDVIYVDGSHTLLDSYSDITLSFEILNIGGILIVDDVPFNKSDILNSPLEGVREFVEKYTKRMKILHVGYRLFVEKLN